MRAQASGWRDTVEARLRALAAVPYLAGLREADLRAMAGEARLVRAATGATIFQEGSPCVGLFVIAAGRVKIVKRSVEGREQVLHVEREGALGEGPLFDGQPYPASAEAMEPSALLCLSRDSVLAWCRRRPEVAIGIARVLARRVRRLAALAEDLALREVAQRLAGYLGRVAEEDGRAVRGGVEVALKDSNQEIANQIGTVRELCLARWLPCGARGWSVSPAAGSRSWMWRACGPAPARARPRGPPRPTQRPLAGSRAGPAAEPGERRPRVGSGNFFRGHLV